MKGRWGSVLVVAALLFTQVALAAPTQTPHIRGGHIGDRSATTSSRPLMATALCDVSPSYTLVRLDCAGPSYYHVANASAGSYSGSTPSRYIAYVGPQGYVRLASQSGSGAWSIDSSGTVEADQVSLGVEQAAGAARHIASCLRDFGVIYQKQTGTTWATPETVYTAPSSSYHVASVWIALGSGNVPYILYTLDAPEGWSTDTEQLWLARDSSGTWVKHKVYDTYTDGGSALSDASLAMAGSTAHFAFTAVTSGTGYHILHGTWSGSRTLDAPFADSAATISPISIGSDGLVQLAYVKIGPTLWRGKRSSGGTWTSTFLDWTSAPAPTLGLNLDNSDRAIVAYPNDCNGSDGEDLSVATEGPSSWAFATVFSTYWGLRVPYQTLSLSHYTYTGQPCPWMVFSDMDDYDEVYFYEVVSASPPDLTAPADVTDLALDWGKTSAVVQWTAPGDDGTTGTATEYDLRRSTAYINSSNFSSATRITTSAPQAAGNTECASVSGLQANHTYYFALKTRDEANNWSSLSNLPYGTTHSSGYEIACEYGGNRALPTEGPLPQVMALGLPLPNPAGQQTLIRYEIPASASGSSYDLGVYDVLGRQVQSLARGIATPGHFTATWSTAGRDGRRASTGVYYVRFRLGSETQVRTVSVLR